MLPQPLKQYDQIVLSQLEEKDLEEVMKCVAAEPRSFVDVLENPSALDSRWLGKPGFGARTDYTFEEVMGMSAQPVSEESKYQRLTNEDHILPVARGSHAIFIKFKEKVAAFEDLLLKCEEPGAASDMTPEKYLMEQEAAISAYEFNIDALLENIQAALSFTGDTINQMKTTDDLKKEMATLRDDENERKDVMRILASSLQNFIAVKKVKETKDLSLVAIEDQIKKIPKGKKIPTPLEQQRIKARTEVTETEEEFNVAKRSIQDLDKKRPTDYPFTQAETNAYTDIFGTSASKKISNTKEEGRVKTMVKLNEERQKIQTACETAEKAFLNSQVANSNAKQGLITTLKDTTLEPYKIDNEINKKQTSVLNIFVDVAAAAAKAVGLGQQKAPVSPCETKQQVMTIDEELHASRALKISLEKNRNLIDKLITFPSVYSTKYLDSFNIDECKEIGFKKKTKLMGIEARDNNKENTQFLVPTFETWVYENKV